MALRASTTLSLIALALLLLSAVIVLRLAEDRELFSGVTHRSSLGMTLNIHGTRVVATIADTEARRVAGLSGRTEFPEGTGLLMKFEEDTVPGIWMKDMNFAIDIVWIDKDWKIVGVTSSVGPESFPAIFYPDAPVRYVLEVPAGFCDRYNIAAGDIVKH